MDSENHFELGAFDQKLKTNFDRFAPENTTLKKAMQYSLFSAGKRIRPQLVYEVSSNLALSEHLSDPLAFAVEMVHAFSLIHDDLPCMDDDDFRRGAPSNHKVFGEPIALLAGDALLTHALGTFGLLSTRVNPSIFSNAQNFLVGAIGVDGIMGGQAMELELTQSTLKTLLDVQSKKTTALFKASILVPVLLAGYSKNDEIYKEYRQFSEAFGFAFQAADDLNDHLQDQQGKQKTLTKNLLSFLNPSELKALAKRQLLDSALTEKSYSARKLLSQF